VDSDFDYPIDASLSAEETDRLLEERLGTYVPAARTISTEVFADLDSHKHGIGWWAPHPDDKRRIFLSDYLAQLVVSFPVNLVEAALHMREVEVNQEESSAQVRHAVVHTGVDASGPKLSVRMPPRTSLRELLPNRLFDLHVAGMFRALGSALDTLAGIAVVVGAFPQKVITADFRKLLDHLKKPLPPTPGGELQELIKVAIQDSVRSAGPDGWMDWTIEYRNMLVHRGRRLQLRTLAQDHGPTILDGQGFPILRARSIVHLARDPKNSDLQAYFGTSPQPSRLSNVLEEDGVRALRNTLEAAVFVSRRVCDVLLEVWRRRRATPDALPQPRAQWPDLSFQPDTFSGFDPTSVPVAPTMAVVSPNMVRRLTSAAIESSLRSKWLQFTG
jgi:hypothetical protein